MPPKRTDIDLEAQEIARARAKEARARAEIARAQEIASARAKELYAARARARGPPLRFPVPGYVPVGSRVVRGPQWGTGDADWGNQDGGPGGEGTVTQLDDDDGWSRVRWDWDGSENSYYNGVEGVVDLALAPSNAKPPAQASFMPASSFRGVRPGYSYKTGEEGLGYYRDSSASASAGTASILGGSPRAAAAVASPKKFSFASSAGEEAPTARQPTPEELARGQEECIATFFKEAAEQELPQDLASKLAGPTPMEDSAFEKLCADLGEAHKSKANPRFFTGALKQQGWLFKRAGNWDFWHKYYAVVRGTSLTFYTVEEPLEELDEKQLQWHSERRVNLALCQAVVPPVPEAAATPEEEEATADFRIAGAHLATGHLELRCDTVAERNEWVACMKDVCPEQAEPEPEPEPEQAQGGEQIGRTSSLTQRIMERTHSGGAAAAAAAAAAAGGSPVPLNVGVAAEGQGLVRQMSQTEKDRLIASLETLPIEAVDRVVTIVQEFQPAEINLDEHSPEINLDELPLPALWRIKSLVDGLVGAPGGGAGPAPADAGVAYTYQWNNDGVWTTYDPAFQAQLRAAHQRGVANGVTETVALQIGRFTYRINLGEMTQRNTDTGNVRQIRTLAPGDDPTAGNAPRREPHRAERQPRPAAEPTEAQIMQLQGFTGAAPHACRAALRRARGNLELAAGILLEDPTGGGPPQPEGPAVVVDDGPPMPSKDEMVHAIWRQLVPEGQNMQFHEMRRFLQLAAQVDGDADANITQEEWAEMCQQYDIDRNTGVTEQFFVELIFDDFDTDDREEMRELFRMYEHIVLVPQRAENPVQPAGPGAPPQGGAAAGVQGPPQPRLPAQPAAAVAAPPPPAMGPGEISITFDQPGILGMEYSRPLGVQSMPHVDDVDAGSPAAAAGVRPGLDLRSVNGREVVGMSDDDFVAVVSARPITMVFVDPAVVVAAGLAAAPPPTPFRFGHRKGKGGGGPPPVKVKGKGGGGPPPVKKKGGGPPPVKGKGGGPEPVSAEGEAAPEPELVADEEAAAEAEAAAEPVRTQPTSILKPSPAKNDVPPPCLDGLELEGDAGRKALIGQVQAALRTSHPNDPSPDVLETIEGQFALKPQEVAEVFAYFRELMGTFKKPSIREQKSQALPTMLPRCLSTSYRARFLVCAHARARAHKSRPLLLYLPLTLRMLVRSGGSPSALGHARLGCAVEQRG